MSASVIIDWGVTGVVVPLFLTIAISVMSLSPPAFLVAKICFSLAALMCVARVGASLVTVDSLPQRVVLGMALFGLIGLGWLESWHWVSERQKATPIVAVISAKPESTSFSGELVKNGGFESSVDYWGTGYLEELIRNGNHPEDEARLPYVVHNAKTKTISHGQRDTGRRRPAGLASFRFEHESQKENHKWGSLSQRINGLKPKTDYAVTFWVSADKVKDDFFFVTTDTQWTRRKYVAEGTYDWTPVRHEFNSESSDWIDLRFVIEGPCTVWIDDVWISVMTPSGKDKALEAVIEASDKGSHILRALTEPNPPDTTIIETFVTSTEGALTTHWTQRHLEEFRSKEGIKAPPVPGAIKSEEARRLWLEMQYRLIRLNEFKRERLG